MKNALFLLVLSILFLAASCNTDDDMPTPITEDTHDILRCKINGEDWEPKGGDLFTSKYDLYYYSDTKGLDLIARNTTTNSILQGAISIDCKVNNINDENKLRFWEDILLNRNFSENCQYFNLDTLQSNYIKVIAIDSIDFYMIGEFEFTTYNECNDTIRLTEGFFDLNYRF